jgi:hypothetical protein
VAKMNACKCEIEVPLNQHQRRCSILLSVIRFLTGCSCLNDWLRASRILTEALLSPAISNSWRVLSSNQGEV